MKTLAVIFMGLWVLPSCSSSDGGNDMDQGVDVQKEAAVDASENDTNKPPDMISPDTLSDTISPDSNGESEIENAFGFSMRLPRKDVLKCTDTFEFEVPDTDWICTFEHDVTKGHVYIQATPVKCVSVGESTAAEFDSAGFISIDGKVTALSDVYYDWGGNHQNNELGFGHGGTYYRYYHSSFGYGWRACHAMDCMQVLKSKGGETIEDGCTSERTLPVVCIKVTPEHDNENFTENDFTDTFKKCAGDNS